MMNSEELEKRQRRNAEQRREFIKQWATFVRTHDDAEWSRQQNTLIDSQLESANELAASGATDPARFKQKMDELRERERR